MLHTTDIAELKKDLSFEAVLHEQTLSFRTTWGLFNPTEIDDGSYLLANALTVVPDATCLDLGCGYGPLGLTLAKLCPKGRVHLVDKDFVAVEYAQKNVKINGLNNCQVYLSNGFSKVPPDLRFDLIVSNLPAKAGKEMIYIMMCEARDHLKPGGKFMVVTISGLKEYIKRNFNEVFGNYEKVDHSKTYLVSSATKQ